MILNSIGEPEWVANPYANQPNQFWVDTGPQGYMEKKRQQAIEEERKRMAEAQERHQREMYIRHSDWVLKWVEFILGPGMSVLYRIDKETATRKWADAGLELENRDHTLVYYVTPMEGMELMRFKGDAVAFFNWSNGVCSVPVQPVAYVV